MEIEFDPAKDAANRAKHGVGLDAAAIILDDPALAWIDRRRDWGETRRVAVGMVGGDAFTCVYTMRGAVARIISVRRARHDERRRLEKAEKERIRPPQDHT